MRFTMSALAAPCSFMAAMGRNTFVSMVVAHAKFTKTLRPMQTQKPSNAPSCAIHATHSSKVNAMDVAASAHSNLAGDFGLDVAARCASVAANAVDADPRSATAIGMELSIIAQLGKWNSTLSGRKPGKHGPHPATPATHLVALALPSLTVTFAAAAAAAPTSAWMHMSAPPTAHRKTGDGRNPASS